MAVLSCCGADVYEGHEEDCPYKGVSTPTIATPTPLETGSLFRLGQYTLACKRKSDWKIECDSLTRDDWKTLAHLVRELAGPFQSVEGVPRGGLILAEELQAYTNPEWGPHLIVDDVLSTGRTIFKAREAYRKRVGREGIRSKGIVIFSRGPTASWIRSVFKINPTLMIK